MVDQVKDLDPRNQYTATSGQTIFPYTFPIFDKDDLVVIQEGTTLAEGTNYTVSGVGDEDGGNVTLLVGATTGDTITIYRDQALERLVDYQTSGDFLAADVNNDFDRQLLMIQQISRDISRALSFAQDDEIVSTQIGNLNTRANKLLAFDASGKLTYQASTTLSPVADSLTDTIAAAKALNLAIGDYVRTGGYTSFNDGGGALYRVVAGGTGTDDGGSYHDMSNGNQLQLINNGTVWLEQFGGTTASSDIGAPANAALTYLASQSGGQLLIGAGDFTQSTTITIPNNTSIIGRGIGFASNWKTRIDYEGSGTAFTYTGFYVELEGFLLRYNGGSKSTSIGINYDAVTRTDVKNVTIQGFGTGITNSKAPTTFTHLHTNVYIKDCTVGVDCAFLNNIVFDKCFIESNGTNVMLDTFFNAIFTNGCVIELFGDARLSETTSSKSIIATNGGNLVVRDCYTETGTLAGAGTNVQFAQITNVKNVTIDSNYWNRSANNQDPIIEFRDDRSSSVCVQHNYFLRGPSTGTDYVVDGASDVLKLLLSSVSGTYELGETVTGGTSGATGVIDSIDSTNNYLYVDTVSGTFSATETITGGTSAATGTLDSFSDLTEVAFSFDVSDNAVKSTLLEKRIEFTPEIQENSGTAISGITYSVQEATCILSGGTCTINGYIALTAAGSGAGFAIEVPIPVTAFSGLGSNNEQQGFFGAVNLSSAFTGLMCKIESGDNKILFLRDYATTIKSNNLTATSQIRFNITFPIDRQPI